MNLLIFGLGYSALHFAQTRGAAFQTTASVTSADKARALSVAGREVMVFAPGETDPRLGERVANADALLVSIPPDAAGDPVLTAFGAEIAGAKALRHIVYLSTIGVYGDHMGAWIDETALCHPVNERSQWRLAAESQWLALAAQTGKAVHILRLAGIYGPGQNALVNLRNGAARRIIKPGQVFNRIHVEDISRAIEACLKHEGGGVWNIADDEPAPAEDVVTFAAQLLGLEPPPAVRFEDARMSPMARSFYAETKRVSNRAMKERLGVELAWPTYREGIRGLWEAGDGRTRAGG